MKPKLYCFNHSYALQVSFFSLITHVVVTSTFGCVQNFVLIKLHLPMFWRLTDHFLRLSPEPYACRGAQACCWMPIGQMPKEMLEDSDFSSTVRASLLFSAVCFLIIYSLFGRWWSWQHVCDFLSFCFSDKMTTNSCHMKTGNFKLGAKSHSYKMHISCDKCETKLKVNIQMGFIPEADCLL